MTKNPVTIIEAHANDVMRGDVVDLFSALRAGHTNEVTVINPADIVTGDYAVVINVSFRQNNLTRLRVQFGDAKFNLTYPDDTLLLVQENEQDKLEAISEKKK